MSSYSWVKGEPYRPGKVAVEKEVGVVHNCSPGVAVVVHVVGVSCSLVGSGESMPNQSPGEGFDNWRKEFGFPGTLENLIWPGEVAGVLTCRCARSLIRSGAAGRAIRLAKPREGCTAPRCRRTSKSGTEGSWLVQIDTYVRELLLNQLWYCNNTCNNESLWQATLDIKALLHTFGELTGLKVNYAKSIMVPINTSQDKL
jgi:hypothetical protein